MIDDAKVERDIAPDTTIVVEGHSKDDLFNALGSAAALLVDAFDSSAIVAGLWQRESLLSTRLDDHVAMPHAQITSSGESIVILAICPDGIAYDGHLGSPVHLAICIVGDPATHLDTLSRVARTLHSSGRIEALVEAARQGDVATVVRLFGDHDSSEDEKDSLKRVRAALVWRQAIELVRSIGARCILLHASAAQSKRYQVPEELQSSVFVITPDELGVPHHAGHRTSGGVSIALLYALTEERIRQDDVVVTVFSSDGSGVLDTIQVTDVSAAFKLFFSVSRELAMDAATQRVMLRVIELVAEIAHEGREGKPVGALFVLGDLPAVHPHCQQMLMNPFKGYDPENRNVLDPGLAETVKELSRIDGAFIISENGVIESAGTYLRVDVDIPDLPAGLGARHAAAAAITAVSDAVAIAVSESTRQVSVFRHGRRVLVL